MGFRRDGKSVFAKQREWAAWLATVSELVREVGLPPSVVASEDAWYYFLDRSYTQAGYLGHEAWFSRESLSSSQSAALWQLLSKWLQERCSDASEDTIRDLQRCYRPRENGGAESWNTSQAVPPDVCPPWV